MSGKSLLTKARLSEPYISKYQKIPAQYARTQERFRQIPTATHINSSGIIADPDSSRRVKEKRRLSSTHSTHTQSGAVVFKNSHEAKAEVKPELRSKESKQATPAQSQSLTFIDNRADES